MNPSRSLIWMTLAPAMCLPFVASLFYFVLFSEYTFSRAIYAGTKVFTLVWPIFTVMFIYRMKLAPIPFRDPRHLQAVPLGLIAGLAITLLMMGLMLTPLALVIVDGGHAIGQKTMELGVLDHYWTFAIFISVFHSALEEYYWRWFVYGQLRAVAGRWTAHILGGVSFGAHHIVIVTQFFPFWWGVLLGSLVGFGGILFSLLYERQKSLVGAWVAHMMIDFGIMAIGYELIS